LILTVYFKNVMIKIILCMIFWWIANFS